MEKIGHIFIHRIMACGLLTLILAACGRSHDPMPLTCAVDSLLEATFPKKSDPGAVVMIMQADSIIYSNARGAAVVDSRRQLSPQCVMNLCSASKTFLTAGLLKLVEQRRLSLDDSLTKFFPSFPPEIFGKITLRHVLNHVSGLPDLRPRTEEQWRAYAERHPSPFRTGPDYRLYGQENELIKFFESLDSVDFLPGERFEYKDAPYLLLPAVIEKCTATPFEEWMKREVFEPAGLSVTSYYNPSADQSNMAHAYRPAEGEPRRGIFRSKDGRWEEYDYGESEFFLTRADNGVCSSAEEFMQWMRALYDGKIISKACLDMANTRFTDTDTEGIGYGLGLYVGHTADGRRKVFHNTSNGGFSIFEAVYPDHDIFYLIFANRADWDRLALSHKMDSIITSNLLPQSQQLPE